LGELKTERAQADVDQRRTITAFADAIEASTFDASRAAEGGKIRVDSAERVRAAVVDALSKIHAMLEDERACRNAGADEFLTKPVKLQDLALVISRHMTKKNGPAV